MVYIVPKKDQFGDLFLIDYNGMSISLPRTLPDGKLEEYSAFVLEAIAKVLRIEGKQGKSLYAEIRNRIVFEGEDGYANITKYVVPKKDQTGQFFNLTVDDNGTQVSIHRSLDEKAFKNCSFEMMQYIAKTVGLTGKTMEQFYDEIKVHIVFEDY